ncbi:MAG: dihydrolipoyl dehydrogenase [Burkholderiales bacterium]|jgi:dihydrolipoamide dehydrogenase|nr:dihydrolipoyl dehydrogenase [Burkholderiales bacterium]
MNTIEIKVPNIGDYSNVPVIELCVKVGDTVSPEDTILILESDKATLDVPATANGVIEALTVKVGDRVSEGTLIATISAGGEKPSSKNTLSDQSSTPKTPSADKPDAGRTKADISCDTLVLGAGPGGYSCAFRAADLGQDTVMVERHPTLGGVCLNVGCIPSKALLHVVSVMEEAASLSKAGIAFAPPKIDINQLRAHKEKVVNRLTTGLTGMAKARNVRVVRGVGQFIDAHNVEVKDINGNTQIIAFKNAVIAAGSEPIALPFMPQDPRIVSSTGALALHNVPNRMLIIGGGIIGLEMATVYSALGAKVTIVELSPDLMPGADRDLVKVWEKKNTHRFEKILLKTGVTAAHATSKGIEVTYSTGDKDCFDLVLVSVGRKPNGKRIAPEAAGVDCDERGFIRADQTMRTNVPHIFAIGDIVGQPMLAHKAVHEGHVAAETIAGHKAAFDALTIPSVAYTHPEIAWVGKTETELQAAQVKFEKAVFPWAANGRAIANGADEGFTKLLFDAETSRILGGAIVGMAAGDLIGEICLAIEMGANATDIGKTIHPHPTLIESVGLAAEVARGGCTDLPPPKKPKG